MMGSATLPRRPAQHLPNSGFDPAVRVGNDQLNTGQTALDQPAEELGPRVSGLRGEHVEPDDLPAAFRRHRRGHHGGHVQDPAALADFLGQRVDPQIAIRPRVQRPVTEQG